MEFVGMVEIMGMSNALTGNNPRDKPFDCSAKKDAKVVPSSYSFPAEDVNPTFSAAFVAGARIAPGVTANSPKLEWLQYGTGAVVPAEVEPVLSSTDGVRYRILATSVVVEPTAACGLNDLTFPRKGNFRLETWLYEKWSNGKLAATWSEPANVFGGCASSP
ncbi:hypothetical protein [Sinorhizobium psoraleae]|uniref:Uncharacterized protein n=1 Tax=Sinorhizobium psoraleae TaxID=520838 RepID=A0ABT4KNH8_9HYPH|nr:hypothetical protein [Sinorhizobium psoraleae]MCZ4093464.1 hypothetical protein [Sinorhizobium psoraleae]